MMTRKQAADEISDYLEDVKGYYVEYNYGETDNGGIIIYARPRHSVSLMESLELEDDLTQGGFPFEIKVYWGNEGSHVEVQVD